MSINVGTAVASIILDKGKFDSGIKSAGRDLKSIGNSSASAEKQFKALGSSMSSVGSTMTDRITLPVAGAGAAFAKTSIEMGNAQSKLQAQLGLTAKEAENLTNKAKRVWADGFGENIDEVTEALKEVKLNIGDISDKELEKVTSGAMTLSNVFQADVTESTRTAGVMMKNFGIDSEKAFDLMTVGFQQGGDYSGELLDTMREYSPQFKSMGYSADQMLQILITGAKSGAWNLDKVGDAIKEFNIRAKDGSKGTATAFQELGLDAADISNKFAKGGQDAQQAMGVVSTALTSIQDPLKRNQIGVQLFGTQYEDLEKNVLSAMLTTKTELGEVEGATKKASETMKQSLGQQLRSVLRELYIAFEPIGQVILDVIKTVLPHLKTLTSAFSSLPGPVKKGIASVVISIGLLGPTMSIFGKVTGAIGSVVGMFGKLGKVSGTVNKVVSSVGNLKKISGIVGPIVKSFGTLGNAGLKILKLISPIKLVTGAFSKFKAAASIFSLLPAIINPPVLIVTAIIAAVAAAGYLIIKNWDSIKKAAKSLWDGLVSIFKGIGDFFKKSIEGWKMIFTGLIDFFKNLGKWIWDGLIGGLKKGWDSVTGFFKNAGNKIKDTFKSLFGINSPSKVFAEYGKNMGEGLILGLDNQDDAIDSKFKGIASRIKGLSGVKPDFEGLNNTAISGMPNSYRNNVQGNMNDSNSSKQITFSPQIKMYLTLSDIGENGTKELTGQLKDMTQNTMKNLMTELFMDDVVRG